MLNLTQLADALGGVAPRNGSTCIEKQFQFQGVNLTSVPCGHVEGLRPPLQKHSLLRFYKSHCKTNWLPVWQLVPSVRSVVANFTALDAQYKQLKNSIIANGSTWTPQLDDLSKAKIDKEKGSYYWSDSACSFFDQFLLYPIDAYQWFSFTKHWSASPLASPCGSCGFSFADFENLAHQLGFPNSSCPFIWDHYQGAFVQPDSVQVLLNKAKYLEECSPTICTWSQKERRSAEEVLAVVFGLIGGAAALAGVAVTFLNPIIECASAAICKNRQEAEEFSRINSNESATVGKP